MGASIGKSVIVRHEPSGQPMISMATGVTHLVWPCALCTFGCLQVAGGDAGGHILHVARMVRGSEFRDGGELLGQPSHREAGQRQHEEQGGPGKQMLA